MLELIAVALIFGATLAVIMICPYRVPEAVAAAAGAGLMMVIGSVRPGEALQVLGEQWNVYGFFLGLMTISALADHAGVFDWVAHQAGRWGKGDARWLYLVIFLAGAIMTAFFSNDATALILMPVVYALVTQLRQPPVLLDRLQPSESAVMFSTAILVGLGTGPGAVGFIDLIGLIQRLVHEDLGTALGFLGRDWFIIGPALGGLLAGPIIAYFASEAKGHGVPEVMKAMALQGGRIRPRVAVAKVPASGLCIGSGGSAGREGPIVQVGAALGSTLGQCSPVALLCRVTPPPTPERRWPPGRPVQSC
jgi:hypothetical protein